MSMDKYNDRAEALSSLFALSRDAVLGVRGGKVLFGNAAAERLFGREVRGLRAAELLPELGSAPVRERFVTAATVDGTVYTLTAVPQGDAAVITLLPPDQDLGAVSAAGLSRLRMAAFRMRVALDALAAESGQGEGARRAFHSYYALLHRIDQLTDVSAITRGELYCRTQPVDLARLLRELVSSAEAFLASRGTALTYDIPEELCTVKGDRERLEQLILILLSNALLHTTAEGRICVGLRREGGRFIVSVDDDGEGMSAEDLAYAFTLREDASPAAAASGAGMGLYIAQGIARLHGGTVVLRSEPGQGTRVRVTLPACDKLCVRDGDAAPARGPELLLTELAELLPNEAYDPKYRD